MFTRRQFIVGAATALAAAAGSRLLLPGQGEASTQTGQPLRVALLSDTHVQSLTSPLAIPVNGKLMRAVADLRQFRPDLWLCNGDVTDHGYVGEYEAFRAIMGKAAGPGQLLVTTGNHEFYDRKATDQESLQRFRDAVPGAAPYRSRLAGPVHLVLLATERWKTAPYCPDWAWLSDEQLAWFDRVLTAHREKPTLVFLHQPLAGTVLGTEEEGNVAQEQQLRSILHRHPQVRLWFSGHTHFPLDQPGQIVTQDRCTFVALGSTFYLIKPSGKDAGASQSRLLEVFPDRVSIRVRDHARRSWFDRCEFSVALNA